MAPSPRKVNRLLSTLQDVASGATFAEGNNFPNAKKSETEITELLKESKCTF